MKSGKTEDIKGLGLTPEEENQVYFRLLGAIDLVNERAINIMQSLITSAPSPEARNCLINDALGLALGAMKMAIKDLENTRVGQARTVH